MSKTTDEIVSEIEIAEKTINETLENILALHNFSGFSVEIQVATSRFLGRTRTCVTSISTKIHAEL